jgi:GH15 family glucan-1,4-alpha-glucosidase
MVIKDDTSEGIQVQAPASEQGPTQPAASAAAPSPFPPIADYSFVSDCHTGALIAPDGSVDWLCVPRFDSPSVFASLLDRGAGSFRLGPFGINHPTSRVYEPGTNVVAATWRTPTGWALVRDALTLGRREHGDEVTPHTRPPADEDAEHVFVRTVECIEGQVDIELVCEPVFDYGRTAAQWSLVGTDEHVADASGGEQVVRLSTDLSIGIEGSSVRARHTLRHGDRAFCALSWAEDLKSPGDIDDAVRRLDSTARYWRSGSPPRWSRPSQRRACPWICCRRRSERGLDAPPPACERVFGRDDLPGTRLCAVPARPQDRESGARAGRGP